MKHPVYCDVIFLLSSGVLRRMKGSENVVKNTSTEKNTRGRRNRDGGCSARATAKRRPYRDHEIGRQIRSLTYQFTKRQNNATDACLIRHGPTSSPNGRGAGSMEKGVVIVLYEGSRKFANSTNTTKFNTHERLTLK